MKQLSKTQRDELTQLCTELRAASDTLEQAITNFNEKMKTEWEHVQTDLDKYNDIVREAEEFRNNIHGDMDSYFSERSEKWQEGDAGSNYSSWMSDWESTLEEASVDQPDEVDQPDFSAVDQLESLNPEPGGL